MPAHADPGADMPAGCAPPQSGSSSRPHSAALGIVVDAEDDAARGGKSAHPALLLDASMVHRHFMDGDHESTSAYDHSAVSLTASPGLQLSGRISC